MEFWKVQEHNQQSPAAIDARSGKEWSYAQMRSDIERIGHQLPCLGRKSLGLLLAQNQYECLVMYLAALNAGSALILLDASLNAGLLHDFMEVYRPDWIYSSPKAKEFAGYRQVPSGEPGLLEKERMQEIEIHPDLALLLNTSGSTGSPKLVRLTLRNLAANADSITNYLGLTAQQRPITSLPMAYSYGLSVINSHLHSGAAIVLMEDSVLRREFWDAIDRHGCTSFAGVPYTYQLLLKIGILKSRGSSLKMLTQAGGSLDEISVRQMRALADMRGWKFFVMYGQTEATARISYVPFDQLSHKIGSVGIPVPGGSLEADQHTGELVYSGPNVMMGYAKCREDLALGDELHGVLRTGDLARQDDHGYFYLTGRLTRFLKLFGKRFNLDDAERIIFRRFGLPVACYGHDDHLIAVIEGCRDPDAVRDVVCEVFDLPRTVVSVKAVKELPRTGSGKLDYTRLSSSGPDGIPQ